MLTTKNNSTEKLFQNDHLIKRVNYFHSNDFQSIIIDYNHKTFSEEKKFYVDLLLTDFKIHYRVKRKSTETTSSKTVDKRLKQNSEQDTSSIESNKSVKNCESFEKMKDNYKKKSVTNTKMENNDKKMIGKENVTSVTNKKMENNDKKMIGKENLKSVTNTELQTKDRGEINNKLLKQKEIPKEAIKKITKSKTAVESKKRLSPDKIESECLPKKIKVLKVLLPKSKPIVPTDIDTSCNTIQKIRECETNRKPSVKDVHGDKQNKIKIGKEEKKHISKKCREDKHKSKDIKDGSIKKNENNSKEIKIKKSSKQEVKKISSKDKKTENKVISHKATNKKESLKIEKTNKKPVIKTSKTSSQPESVHKDSKKIKSTSYIKNHDKIHQNIDKKQNKTHSVKNDNINNSPENKNVLEEQLAELFRDDPSSNNNNNNNDNNNNNNNVITPSNDKQLIESGNNTEDATNYKKQVTVSKEEEEDFIKNTEFQKFFRAFVELFLNTNNGLPNRKNFAIPQRSTSIKQEDTEVINLVDDDEDDINIKEEKRDYSCNENENGENYSNGNNELILQSNKMETANKYHQDFSLVYLSLSFLGQTICNNNSEADMKKFVENNVGNAIQIIKNLKLLWRNTVWTTENFHKIIIEPIFQEVLKIRPSTTIKDFRNFVLKLHDSKSSSEIVEYISKELSNLRPKISVKSPESLYEQSDIQRTDQLDMRLLSQIVPQHNIINTNTIQNLRSFNAINAEPFVGRPTSSSPIAVSKHNCISTIRNNHLNKTKQNFSNGNISAFKNSEVQTSPNYQKNLVNTPLNSVGQPCLISNSQQVPISSNISSLRSNYNGDHFYEEPNRYQNYLGNSSFCYVRKNCNFLHDDSAIKKSFITKQKSSSKQKTYAKKSPSVVPNSQPVNYYGNSNLKSLVPRNQITDKNQSDYDQQTDNENFPCDVCANSASLMCSKCCSAAYCSEPCAIKDWNEQHHRICQKLT